MAKSDSNRCVVLARVSSRAQDDEGYSLDAQERLATEYCLKIGLKVVKLFRITETASKSAERSTFNQMMKYLTQNRIKNLVVEKSDRVTRNFKDMVMIDDWLETDETRQVHLIKDGLVMYKHSRSQDKLNWGVKVLFAKNYTDNLREEVYKGRHEKLAQGWLPAPPPFGYVTVGAKSHKTHIPHPETSRLIRQLFETYLEPSHSLTTVTKLAADIGIRTRSGRPMCRSAITKSILKNPFFIGINRWEGVEYPGNQEPIIDEALFRAVQAKMTRKTAPKYQKHNPDFRGVMNCSDCGGTIGWELQRGTWYGRCNRYKGCPKKQYAKQPDVEKQLFEHFEKLLCPSEEIAEWIIDSLKAKHQNDIYDHSASLDVLRSEQDRKKRRLDLLYEDRLNERITTERYDELSAKIMDEQKEADSRVANMTIQSQKRLITGVMVLERSQQAAKVYAAKSPEEKRILLGELFTSLKLDGGQLDVEYNPYSLAISKRVKKHVKTVKDFRTNKKSPTNSADEDLTNLLRLLWCTR